MKIFNKTKNTYLCSNVKIADSFFLRFLGLMFKKSLPFEEGLLIHPAYMIHTCFMRFDMAAVFISKEKKVTGIIALMKPWSFSSYYAEGYYVLELNWQYLDSKASLGDELIFES